MGNFFCHIVPKVSREGFLVLLKFSSIQKTIVAEASNSRNGKELKLELIFGSHFHSRLERCVTNAPFVV